MPGLDFGFNVFEPTRFSNRSWPEELVKIFFFLIS
jgi:hypothetical protein